MPPAFDSQTSSGDRQTPPLCSHSAAFLDVVGGDASPDGEALGVIDAHPETHHTAIATAADSHQLIPGLRSTFGSGPCKRPCWALAAIALDASVRFGARRRRRSLGPASSPVSQCSARRPLFSSRTSSRLGSATSRGRPARIGPSSTAGSWGSARPTTWRDGVAAPPVLVAATVIGASPASSSDPALLLRRK
jgi:hypothetical protein